MMPPRSPPAIVLRRGVWFVVLWVALSGISAGLNSIRTGVVDPLVLPVTTMTAILMIGLLWAGTVVARDAWTRGLNPVAWGLLVVAVPLGLLVLVAYLVVREAHPPMAMAPRAEVAMGPQEPR